MGQRTMEVPAGLTSSRQPVTNTLAMDFSTQLEHACESPIAVEDLHLPMPALVTLQPRFPLGGLTISRCVDALIRQDLLDPLPYVRRHICGDWGDVRAEHRRYNDAALELGGYLLSFYVISDGLDLCVFTEADRDLTAVFLLDEY